MAEERDWLAPLWDLLSVMSPAEAEAKVVARDPQAHRLMEAMARGDVMPEGQEPDPLVSGRFDPERKQLYQQVFEAAQKRPETTTVGMTKSMIPGEEQTLGFYEPQTRDITLREYDPFYSHGQLVTSKGPDEKINYYWRDGTRYTSVVPTALSYQDTLAHELVHFLLPPIQQDLQKKGLPPRFETLFRGISPELRAKLEPVFLQLYIGSPEAQHDFIRYMSGSSTAPMEQTPTGVEQPSSARIAERMPFLPSHVTTSPQARDIWSQVLQRIISDPQLLKKALAPLQSPVGRR